MEATVTVAFFVVVKKVANRYLLNIYDVSVSLLLIQNKKDD